MAYGNCINEKVPAFISFHFPPLLKEPDFLYQISCLPCSTNKSRYFSGASIWYHQGDWKPDWVTYNIRVLNAPQPLRGIMYISSNSERTEKGFNKIYEQPLASSKNVVCTCKTWAWMWKILDQGSLNTSGHEINFQVLASENIGNYYSVFHAVWASWTSFSCYPSCECLDSNDSIFCLSILKSPFKMKVF